MPTTTIKSFLLRLSLIFIIVGNSFNGSSQLPFTGIHFTMSMANCAQVSTNALEFDLYLQFDGSSSPIELLGYSYGINYNTAILNGGNVSFTQVGARDAALNILVQQPLNSLTPGHLRITTTGASAGNGVTINSSGYPVSINYKIGRFKLATSATFTINSAAGLNLQCAQVGGKTNLAAIYSFNGATSKTATSFSTNPPQPAMACTAANCCSGLAITSPITPSINTNGISPTTINAGIGSILTINGTGFGACRGGGNVQFTNADDPLSNLKGRILEDIDYYSWSDTKIEIILPSITTDPNIPSPFNFTPGSGNIKVENSFGNVSSSSVQAVQIDYAIHTNNTITTKRRQCLSRYKCNNGFTFYLGNSIPDGSDKQKVIDSAFTAWSNYLNIDIKFARDGAGNIIHVPDVQVDNDISTIIELTTLPTPNLNALMATKRYVDPTVCNSRAMYVAADIMIKQSINSWHYGINDSLPQGLTDFYSAILHEIGHAIGLDHAIDLGTNGTLELLYIDQSPGQAGGTPASGRKTLSSSGGNSAAGAILDIVNFSRGLNVTGCANHNPLTAREISSPFITPAAPLVICTGSNTILSSSAVNSSATGNTVSNLWNAGAATTQAITVGGSTATYTVSVKQNNSCPVTASRLVTVSGTSNITTQPSNAQTICTGGNTASFTCISAGATYQWQKSIASGPWANVSGSSYSGTTASTLNILQAIYYSGQSQQYRCIVTQPGFCPTPSNAVTLPVINVDLTSSTLPSVFTGSPVFALSGGVPSGGTYSGTGVSGTSFTPPGTAGNYTITYSKSGCNPVSASQTIQVVSCNGTYPSCIKAITTNDVPLGFCLGGSSASADVLFTALGCPYTIGNIFTAQLSNASGSFANAVNIGSVNLTGGSLLNCTGTINASILPGTPVGSAYRIRVVSNNPPFTGSANLYAISIDHTPCSGNSPVQGKLAVTYNDDDIKIYPNPASESLTVKLPANSNFNNIRVFDINGRIIRLMEAPDNDEINIDVSDIQSGIYIVVVSSGIQTIHKKVIITK